MKDSKTILKRRRVPRRDFTGRVGVLVAGEYTVNRAVQIGEGGIMIEAPILLSEGQQVVVSFRIPNHNFEIVRATVRYTVTTGSSQQKQMKRYGLEFDKMDFSVKRLIRNYVALSSTTAVSAD